MGQLRLNLLVIVLVGLSPVLSFGVAEEPPPPSEGICYKVFYEAMKLRISSRKQYTNFSYF